MKRRNTHFKPLPARSVGLITHYRCTFHCEHCLYCASPGIREEIREENIGELIRQMDRVLGPVPLHIGGGEPLLFFDRIQQIVSRVGRTRLILEYVETNGSTLLTDRREKLQRLQKAGLRCLLVSISPFHQAFLPLLELKALLRDVLDVFGPGGLFPWHPGYLPFLERFSSRQTLPVSDYFRRFSNTEIRQQLTAIMYIHPGGRAAQLLARYLPCHPAEVLLKKDCSASLASPDHAHLDHEGNVLTGFCSGLRLGEETGLDLDSLYGKGLPLHAYPLLDLLVHEGLGGLYDYAKKTGYEPRRKGYVAPCHLCLDIRRHLYFQEGTFPELYPAFFYEELGCPGIHDNIKEKQI